MLSNHPLNQIAFLESGIEKTIALLRQDPDRRKSTAAFNRKHQDAFNFILDASIDYPDLIDERQSRIVFSYLYVTYVNELCRLSDAKNRLLFNAFVHYHDVFEPFEVLKRDQRRIIAEQMKEITDAVVQLDTEKAHTLGWKHIKYVGKCLRDTLPSAPGILPLPVARVHETVSLPRVESLVKNRIRNIKHHSRRYVTALRRLKEEQTAIKGRLTVLMRVQSVAFEAMAYEKGELYEAVRRMWLTADAASHDVLYQSQSSLIGTDPKTIGWNPVIVSHLGSHARPGHVKESIDEMRLIYKALDALDADMLHECSLEHIRQNVRRYASIMRSGGGFRM